QCLVHPVSSSTAEKTVHRAYYREPEISRKQNSHQIRSVSVSVDHPGTSRGDELTELRVLLAVAATADHNGANRNSKRREAVYKGMIFRLVRRQDTRHMDTARALAACEHFYYALQPALPGRRKQMEYWAFGSGAAVGLQRGCSSFIVFRSGRNIGSSPTLRGRYSLALECQTTAVAANVVTCCGLGA